MKESHVKLFLCICKFHPTQCVAKICCYTYRQSDSRAKRSSRNRHFVLFAATMRSSTLVFLVAAIVLLLQANIGIASPVVEDDNSLADAEPVVANVEDSADRPLIRSRVRRSGFMCSLACSSGRGICRSAPGHYSLA